MWQEIRGWIKILDRKKKINPSKRWKGFNTFRRVIFAMTQFVSNRAVLCTDPEMTTTPVSFPGDTFKLRIEKTAIRKVPRKAFRSLHHLEILWLPYNALASLSVTHFRDLFRLQELRLGGNALPSFPWEALRSMPQLRLLDLHSNELASLPAEAARYLENITYLDVSSNKLAMLPQDLIAVWSRPQAVPYIPRDDSRTILGEKLRDANGQK